MLLPYASDRPPRNLPVVVAVLVLANFLIFGIFALGFSKSPEAIIDLYTSLSLTPTALRWYSPVTYLVLHASVLHLSINMLFLWVFGGSVEDAIGRKRFVILYVVAGVLTGLLQVAMTQFIAGSDHTTPIVGASGAISALVGVFAVRFYRSRIRFVGIPFRIPAIVLLAAVLLAEMGWTIVDLLVRSPAYVASSAHWAHIGGFVLGLLWAQAFRLTSEGRHEYLEADAVAALERGDPLTAARKWEAVLLVKPNDPAAYAEMGRAWGEVGDKEQCVAAYHQSITIYLQLRNRRQAATAYRGLSHFHPIVLPLEELLAVARGLEELREYVEAVAAYELLCAEYPDSHESAMAELRAGIVSFERLHEKERAVSHLSKFIDGHSKSEWRDYALKTLRSINGKTDSGRPIC